MKASTTTPTAPSPIAASLLGNSHMGRALNMGVPSLWPEGADYVTAEQPEAIGGVLVSLVHKHLEEANIGYVFKEKMSGHGKVTLAKASKANSKLAFYTNLDFCIDVNFATWIDLSVEQRIALVDHELCHFGIESTEDGMEWVLLPHDVEEFRAIVSRWGLWKPDLKHFGRAVTEQLSLLEEPAG